MVLIILRVRRRKVTWLYEGSCSNNVLRAVKWQGEGSLSPQEVTLKFQEWLLARQINSLFEALPGPLVPVEELLDENPATVETVLKAIEKEYDNWLVTTPLLGYDSTGTAVVHQTVQWLHRAEAVFTDLDAERRRYLVSDSLIYLVLAMKPGHANTETIHASARELLRGMTHWQGQVTSLGFKVYLLRNGYSTMQSITTLQVRIKRLARVWTTLKTHAAQAESESMLSYCGYFGHCPAPFPSIIEQSIQLALPVTYPDFADLQSFLRLSFPSAVATGRAAENTEEEVVTAMASLYSGELTQSLLLILLKCIHFYTNLTGTVINNLLSNPDSPSSMKTAKHSPVRPSDSVTPPTRTLTPSYFRHTISSNLKHSQRSPPRGLLNTLLLREESVPKVRLSMRDLRPRD